MQDHWGRCRIRTWENIEILIYSQKVFETTLWLMAQPAVVMALIISQQVPVPVPVPVPVNSDSHGSLSTVDWKLITIQCWLLALHCTLAHRHWKLMAGQCRLLAMHCTLANRHWKLMDGSAVSTLGTDWKHMYRVVNFVSQFGTTRLIDNTTCTLSSYRSLQGLIILLLLMSLDVVQKLWYCIALLFYVLALYD